MSNFRHIEVRRNGAVHVVHFREHKILNDMVIEKVGQEMFSVAADEECTNLLLNFSNVGFLSSSVLGKLITLNKRMKAKDGQLKLCELKPEIRELFTLTSLDKIFDIKDDETGGLLAFY
jgi:anti-sigma B factor antagonist